MTIEYYFGRAFCTRTEVRTLSVAWISDRRSFLYPNRGDDNWISAELSVPEQRRWQLNIGRAFCTRTEGMTIEYRQSFLYPNRGDDNWISAKISVPEQRWWQLNIGRAFCTRTAVMTQRCLNIDRTFWLNIYVLFEMFMKTPAAILFLRKSH